MFLAQTSVPEPDKGTKTTIKDGVLIHGDDEDDRGLFGAFFFCILN